MTNQNNNNNQNLFDTDTSNYSLSELMLISGINDLNRDEIIDRTNTYIHQFKYKNPILATFFRNSRNIVIKASSAVPATLDAVTIASSSASLYS